MLTRTNKELEAFIASLFAPPKPAKPLIKRQMTIEEEKAEIFYSKIWDELRILYNSYLLPGQSQLHPDEVRKLIVEVLR